MISLDNFLTSSHNFKKNENLEKFRFALLNIIMFMVTLSAILHVLALLFGFLPHHTLFLLSLSVFAIISLAALYVLRLKKSFYFIVVYILLIGSAFLFYFGLFTHPEDEFRLIVFFLLLFVTFVLLGKKYGLSLSIFIFLSIVIISNIYDLSLSSYALATFYTFFICFSVFLYFFLDKVEKDAIEFQVLNTQLQKKASQETQLRHTQEKLLLEQSRLASLGDMLNSIAHQWKQPLMSINAVLLNMDRALETKDSPNTYLGKKIDEISMLTLHMSQTIEDFRSMFKSDKEKKCFFLLPTTQQALTLFQSSTKEIEFSINIPEELSYYGYENELIQVLIILFSNAIEALQLNNIKTKEISIDATLYDKAITLHIEDNAEGIPKNCLGNIFKPHFTTKEITGGTGLGLYIAKIIVETNLQGTLGVENTKFGAKFKILLPIL